MPPTFSKNFANISTEKPEKQQGPATRTNTNKRDVRYLFSIGLCIVSVLLSGLLYGADIYFDRQIALAEENIESQGEAIQPEVIHNLITFDKQIHTLRDFVVLRSGYLPILQEISAVVVDGVQYTQAEISLNENREYEVRVDGIARSPEVYLQQLKSIEQAAQRDTDRFAKLMDLNKYVIQRDKDGTNLVLFTLTMRVSAEEFTPSSLKNTEAL